MTTKLLLITCFLLAAKNLIGQPSIQWQKTIGGTNEDNVYIIQQTNDKGYVMMGYSNSDSTGEKIENHFGQYDFWVVKIDSIGVIQWQKTLGGTLNELGTCIRQTNDGGYIVGGSSESVISGNKDSSGYGMMDYWIVKLDANGQKQWEKVIGSNNDDFLYSVYQTNDGGYVLGGRSNSASNGIKSESSFGGFDYWIVKLDSTANIIKWENTIGGSSDDYLLNLNLTNDGGYILAGKSNSPASFDKTENSMGDYDYWVVKLDSAGIVQWDNTIGGVQHDELSCVQQANDGSYILGGVSNSDSTGDKTENSKGDYDYWVVKLNVTGDTIEWQNTIGGNNTDGFEWLQQTIDGGYILGGYSNSTISGDKTQDTIGGFDDWIVKLNATGNIQWQKTFGGTFDDYLYYLQQTSDGGYITSTRSVSAISGDKTDSCRGGMDYWSVKLAPVITPVINGNALCFDGSNDRVEVANDSLLNTSHISLQAWVRLDGGSWPYSCVVTKRNCCGANLEQWTMQFEGYGHMHFHTNTDSGTVFLTDTNVLQTGVWTHFTATYDGDSACLYRNGILIALDTTTRGNIIPKSFPVVIGDRDGGLDWWPGAIDEVRIWDRALTQQEILATMNCHLSGNETGLIAYYDFNQGIAGGNNLGIDVLPDLTPHGLNGTLQNFALSGSCSNWINSFFMDSSVSLIAQPANQNLFTNDSAVFNVASNSANATFQWQTDSASSGFHNIFDGSQYSGTSDDTLHVNAVSLQNQNQMFRCIVSSSGFCGDTSNAAILTVNTGVGISSIDNINGIYIFPNPSIGNFTIDFGNLFNSKSRTIIIRNVLSQIIFETKTNQQKVEVNLAGIVPGIYFIETSDEQSKMIQYKKVVIN
jgi:hypothetical protein